MLPGYALSCVAQLVPGRGRCIAVPPVLVYVLSLDIKYIFADLGWTVQHVRRELELLVDLHVGEPETEVREHLARAEDPGKAFDVGGPQVVGVGRARRGVEVVVELREQVLELRENGRQLVVQFGLELARQGKAVEEVEVEDLLREGNAAEQVATESRGEQPAVSFCVDDRKLEASAPFFERHPVSI